MSPASPEAAIVALLKAAHARRKEANKDAALSPPPPSAPASTLQASASAPRRLGGVGGGAGPWAAPGGGGRGLGIQGGATQRSVAATFSGVGPFGGAPGGFDGGAFGGGGGGGGGEAGAGADNGESGGKDDRGSGEAVTGSHEEVEALLVDGKKEEVRVGSWFAVSLFYEISFLFFKLLQRYQYIWFPLAPVFLRGVLPSRATAGFVFMVVVTPLRSF